MANTVMATNRTATPVLLRHFRIAPQFYATAWDGEQRKISVGTESDRL